VLVACGSVNWNWPGEISVRPVREVQLLNGWAQAWTAALLALRERGTTVWDFTAKTRVRDHFQRLKAQMLPDSP